MIVAKLRSISLAGA